MKAMRTRTFSMPFSSLGLVLDNCTETCLSILLVFGSAIAANSADCPPAAAGAAAVFAGGGSGAFGALGGGGGYKRVVQFDAEIRSRKDAPPWREAAEAERAAQAALQRRAVPQRQ